MRIERYLAWLALASVLVFGSHIRLSALGRPDLSHDELIHYFAAQSVMRDAGPHLPSGEEYRRGLDITRLGGIGASLARDAELGMRLPSAMFGVLNLLLIAAIGWAIGGPWVAVVATLLLAIHPEAVAQSRGVRFYTYQLNFGLVALFATWRLVRQAGRHVTEQRAEIGRTIGWGLLAGAAFLLAARVQITTLSVLAGAGLAVVVAAATDLWMFRRQAWRGSVALYVTSAGAALLLLVLVLEPSLVARLIAQSQHQPLWARLNEGSPLAYYRMLSETFPLLLALAPAIFVVVALRDVRLASFLACWFGVPFVLHSFAFPWKGERFILLAMPAFFLAVAVAVAVMGGALRSAIERAVCGVAGRRLARVAIAMLGLFAIFATPALHRSRKMPSGASEPMFRRERWEGVAAVLRAVPGVDSLPLGSSTPLAALHYIGRADFAVRKDALGRPVGRLALVMAPSSSAAPAEAGFGEFTEGVPDYYSGVPSLTTPEGIRSRFGAWPGVILVIDSTRWVFGDIEPALKETLAEEADELCDGRCGALMAFRWSFAAIPARTAP